MHQPAIAFTIKKVTPFANNQATIALGFPRTKEMVMPAQAAQSFFEEEQSFRQPWVWALMGVTLVVLVIASGFVILGTPVKDRDILAASAGLAMGSAVVLGAA